MKFKELIDTVFWEFVENELKDWYYKDKEYPPASYQKVFQELKLLEPKDSNMRICLSLETLDGPELLEKPYVHVSGKDGSLQKDSEDFQYNTQEEKDKYGNTEITWAIEFRPWDEFLGMTIDKETLNNFTSEEIVCHILYEMTFCGYDQEEIQSKFEDLQARADEVKNMTKEDLEKNTISLEDLMKKLGSDSPE